MILNISVIKSAFINTEPFSKNQELRNELKKILSNEFLFSNNIINSICLFNNNIHIGSDSAKLVIQYLNNKFNTSFEIRQLKKYGKYSKEKLEFFKIHSFDDFKFFFDSLHKEKCEKKQQRRISFNSPLPLKFINKKLLSVDFEYRESKNNIEILEMGISISYNNETSHYHYITSTRKQNFKSFNFGNSIVIEQADFLPIFESHLCDVDYIIGHSLDMEYKVLKSNNFDCTKIDNIPFIDTSSILRLEFKILNSGKPQKSSISLKNAMRLFGINVNNFHNAGNDAAYTLELVNRLVEYKTLHLESGGKKKLICVSSHNSNNFN